MNTSNNYAAIAKVLGGSHLPALPQSAVRLLELSQDPNNGPPEFAIPIEADPGLAGQVLRFVNSSYFGFSREISSVKLAIALVGVRTVKNFVLWSAVFSLMPNPRCGSFDLRSLWVDSLRRGVLARRLAKRLGLKESEEIFAASLLQDMAIPLLAKELGSGYSPLLDAREGGRRRVSELERDTFGWTHAEASAWMASKWSLPQRFVDLILTHVDTDRLLRGELEASAACVACSALLPASGDAEWWDRETFMNAYQLLCRGQATDIREVFREIDVEFEDFSNILKLSGVARSLESWLDDGTACSEGAAPRAVAKGSAR